MFTQEADAPTRILRRIVPRGLKSAIKKFINRQIQTAMESFQREISVELEQSKQELRTGDQPSARLKHFRDLFFLAHQYSSECYLVPKAPGERRYHGPSSLPIPPMERWEGYGQTNEHYLASGEEHVRSMREILERAGTPLETTGRILDFGCASGRMIRWLEGAADTCEIWGTDINSSHIIWCNQNLSPPFHFATTTSCPHLPFEDRYFGLVYAGSVFTHLDDLADTWFQELRRVLRPGGRLFITIHDKSSIEIMKNEWPPDYWLMKVLRTYPEFEQFVKSDFGMFAIGRSTAAQVFHDVEYLSRRLEPFFHTLSVTPRGYSYQTAVLLERI